LITNAQGKSLGFDPNKRQLLNEIPEAEIREMPPLPTYLLPSDNSNSPYRIILAGRASTSEARTDLTISGAGFVAGFKDLVIAAGKILTVTFTTDGRRLSLTAGDVDQAPALFTSTQSGRSKPSYAFEIGGARLAQGKTVAVTLDMESQRLYFNDDDLRRDKYSIKIRRTNPDGTKNAFLRQDILFGKADNYMLDFSKWDGITDLCLYVDDMRDGFDKKECIKLSAQK